MVRYLDPPPSLFFGPPAELVRVRSVSPDQLQLRQLLLQLVAQEPLRAVAVVQAGGVNASAEYQPTGVHEQVALPARESLGPVVATFWTADTGGFHDLAVQDRPAGIAISTLRFAYRRSKSLVGLLQAPVPPPLAKVVVDGLITNDKFCFTRHNRLKLRRTRRGYPSRQGASRGGDRETKPDHSSHDGGSQRRRSSLGAGISTPVSVGGSGAAGGEPEDGGG